MIVQVVIGIALVVWQLMQGPPDPQRMRVQLIDVLANPPVFLGILVLSQGIIGLAAFIPARLSPEPLGSRLGLVRSGLDLPWYPIVMMGAWFPAAIGMVLAQLLAQIVPPDSTLKVLYERMTGPIVVPYILAIALMPGLLEEALFRGYMQRRLLQRWPSWLAILVVSLLFAVMHINPHQVLFAFPIGCWLGLLAWRTGSIWPSVACHAFINGSWNCWLIGRRMTDPPLVPPLVIWLPLALLVVVCFALSVWLVARHKADDGISVAANAPAIV